MAADRKIVMNDQREKGQERRARQVSRRDALKTGGALALGLVGTAAGQPARAATAVRGVSTSLIRFATVRTIVDGGLLQDLLPHFKTQTGHRVGVVYVGDDVYGQARSGKVDIAFSHFGHKEVEAFITKGFGQWPRAVLFNQITLMIPPHDPAQVRGLADPLQAFHRIARTRSPFVVNHLEGLEYLADTLWHAIGRPKKAGWYLDRKLKGEAAMRMAAVKGGYTLWGITPFLVGQRHNHLALVPVVFDDPLFQRIMVSIVVNPARFPHANIAGALTFQQYLLNTATQARIQAFRHPGITHPIFWPAGRNNAPALLPLGGGPGK